jgi:hypothetical protein
MSERSMIRAHEREARRNARRSGRRARHAGVATLAIGAGVAFAPGAQAANIQVDTLGDAGPVNGCGVGTCKLRDAIDDANEDPGSDTITFAGDLNGELRLIQGELPISSAMSIHGPGAGVVSISGDASNDNVPNLPDSRIAYIDTSLAGTQNDDVSISGLELTEGVTTGPATFGGAIYSQDSDLTISDSVLDENLSVNFGGAIFSKSGKLTVLRSTLADNTAGGEGGAIFTDDANNPGPSDVVIRSSTIAGNEATDFAGGGLYADDGTDSALIAGSTFFDNKAGTDGGGLYLYGPDTGATTLLNTTVTGNTASGAGGGIFDYGSFDRPVVIDDSTIAGNMANYGGGVYRNSLDNAGSAGVDVVTLSSSIVADNTATGDGDDLYDGNPPTPTGDFVIGFSLIGSDPLPTAVVVEAPAGSNQVNVDPLLGPLNNNGGPTETMRPAKTSPVVDAGIANELISDQRGYERTSDVPASNAEGSDGTDIGAVELQAPATTITAGPDGPTSDDTPTFTFSSPVRGATFQCRIDTGAFAPCISPKQLGPLADGDHVFGVRASVPEGFPGPTNSTAFTVDTVVSGASAHAKKKQKQGGHIKLKVKVGADETVTAEGTGKVKVKKKTYKLKAVTKQVAAAKRTVLKLKPARKHASKKIAKALGNGKHASSKVSVKFTDSLGSTDTEKLKIKLKRKRK